MPQSDLWVTAQYIYTTLNVSAVTDLATGIYRNIAPPDAVEPYVVIKVGVAGSDLMVVGTRRIWYRGTADVIVVGTELQAEAVDQIAAACDGLLHGSAGPTTDGQVFECTRNRPIFFSEVDEGVQYIYSGGEYMIAAKAA